MRRSAVVVARALVQHHELHKRTMEIAWLGQQGWLRGEGCTNPAERDGSVAETVFGLCVELVKEHLAFQAGY